MAAVITVSQTAPEPHFRKNLLTARRAVCKYNVNTLHGRIIYN